MRVYYIFLIKKEVYNITKDNPEGLFKLLESIYLLDKKELSLAFKMFDKLCKRIPLKNFNKLIKDTSLDNLSYTCYLNNHIINDFLNNETTKLTVYNSHIKVKSNSTIPTFFKCLNNIPYLFVVDFNNIDYFYLKNIYSR